MKRVLFVLLCAAAIVAIPACKQMSCDKNAAEVTVPTEQAAPAVQTPAVPVAEVPVTPAPVTK
jgi:hypothetical protein